MNKFSKSASKKLAKKAAKTSAVYYKQAEIEVMLSPLAATYAKAIVLGLNLQAYAAEQGGAAQETITHLTKGEEAWEAEIANGLLQDGALGLGKLVGGPLTIKKLEN